MPRRNRRVTEQQPSGKGPYIKDVRTGRGEGGSPKADIVREVAWIYSYRSSKNADGGGGGPKTRKFCGRPLCMAPKQTGRQGRTEPLWRREAHFSSSGKEADRGERQSQLRLIPLK